MRKITLIVVHCTASRCTATLTPVALDAEHGRRGFIGCGYHYYITKNGTVHPMRDVTLIGAHAKGFNADSIGIAYEGGLDADGKPADTRTPEQRQSLATLLRHLLIAYPHITAIVGHRDLSPDLNGNGTVEPQEWIKMCPCFNASAEYQYLFSTPSGSDINDTKPNETVANHLHPEPAPETAVTLPVNQLKEEKVMKPFWKTTLKVLKFVCKLVTWLTGGDGESGTGTGNKAGK